ncbi:hypothetical protein G6O69_20140 [Pseudenhygromyxa sp. WMMC2535]|uniref:hypothetical protein n=1 Tax=Pseudenhygromyxa sp. WMMC2535 TaxID=2712867 RepID=UPI0015565061|nr:hypothetical protein [Pseudenhygromyxa sp. WMMC2535]NVB40168.1 hypothetical protein [Pseudenhygromyxa sp. WMMC2535]
MTRPQVQTQAQAQAATRELEQALYAYVFADEVGERFRAYRERTRVERFRAHYLVRLAEPMRRLLPRFISEVGAPAIDDVVRLRVRLPDPSWGAQALVEHYADLAAATAERHPRASLARELFWLERARALTLAAPPAQLDELLAAIDTLANAPEDAPLDRPPLRVVPVRSSLPELLAMPLSDHPTIEVAARTPWTRRAISYHDARDGRLHRKVGRDLDELRALVSTCPGGIDL